MSAEIVAIIIWTLLMTSNVIMLAYILKINIETREHRKDILDMDLKFLQEERRNMMAEPQ